MNELTGNWEPLGKEIWVFVTKEHRFNTDTILLANFASPKKKDVCADFGTGCGTIPLIWAEKFTPKKIYAVELQKQAALQGRMSFEKSQKDIILIENDIRKYKEIFNNNQLDLIACNPPYKADGAGIKNSNENMKIARHEEELTLEDLAKSAKYSLKFGGRICICQRPERLADVICTFSKYGLEPKKLRMVQGNKDKAPALFLLECRLGGNVGMKVLPTLVIMENGNFTEEMNAIYGEYKENKYGKKSN